MSGRSPRQVLPMRPHSRRRSKRDSRWTGQCRRLDRGLQIDQGEVSSALRKLHSDGAADAAARAGDDGHLAFQRRHPSLPPKCDMPYRKRTLLERDRRMGAPPCVADMYRCNPSAKPIGLDPKDDAYRWTTRRIFAPATDVGNSISRRRHHSAHQAGRISIADSTALPMTGLNSSSALPFVTCIG